MKLFSNFRSRVRYFFFLRYVRFVEFVTLYMIARTGKLVRSLLLLKGKNPDYVVPPPPPPPAPKSEYVLKDEAVAAKRSELVSRFTSGSGSNNSQWVKDPSTHPVIKSRLGLAAKAAKDKADREARMAKYAPVPPPIDFVLSEMLDNPQVVATAASTTEETTEKEFDEGEKDLG